MIFYDFIRCIPYNKKCFLTMRKWRIRGSKQLAQEYPAGDESRDQNLDLPPFKQCSSFPLAHMFSKKTNRAPRRGSFFKNNRGAMRSSGAKVSNKPSKSTEHHQDSLSYHWATYSLTQFGMPFLLMVLSYINSKINFINLRFSEVFRFFKFSIIIIKALVPSFKKRSSFSNIKEVKNLIF